MMQDAKHPTLLAQSRTRLLLTCGGLAGIAAVSLGLVVIVGWYLGNRTLIQVLPQFVPMQYNTALGFVLCGVGLTMLVAGHPRIGAVFGAAAAIIGGLTLVEYVGGVSLGIDQLLMKHDITIKTSHPGRMAPNTAACFLLFGLSVALRLRRWRPMRQSVLTVVLGSLTFGLSMVALSGYTMGLETAYGWGNLTRMAVHTSVGFVVVSCGLLCFVWSRDAINQAWLPDWMPIPLGIAILTATVCLWQALNAESIRFHREHADITSIASLAILMLVVGVLLAIAMALVAFLAQQSSRRSRAIIESNKKLQGEILERQHAERTLKAHKDSLEETVTDRTRELEQALALTKKQAIFFRVFKDTTDPIVLEDLSGIVIDLNGAAEHAYGWQRNELTGKPIKLIVPQDRRKQADELLSECLHGGDVRNVEGLRVARDGTVYDVLITLSLLKDENDEPIAIASIAKDITSLRQARAALEMLNRDLEAKVEMRTSELAEAEQRSRLLLESTRDGIFGVDTDGVVTFVNASAAKLLGFHREELRGQPVHALIHHSHEDGIPYPSEQCPMCHAYTEGTVSTVDDEVLWRKDGTSFNVEYTSVPIRRDDAIIGAVVVFRDISQRKKAEEALREAMQKAEEATRAKSDFLANMSHEIRTPMNGIIGMTDLTLDTDLTLEQRDYLNTVKTSADALLTLINDILDFSKIEAGKLEIEPIDFALRDTLADMLTALASRAHSKGLELVHDVPPEVHDALVGDVHRMRQVIVNLVGNAIKFTKHGEVVVSVAEIDRTDQNTTLQFSVTDTGIGIPLDKIEAIFKPFEQADTSTTRRFGGTGLGLAISVQLADLMGGRVWAESELGRGSTFHFTAVFGLGKAVPTPNVQQRRELLDGLPVLVVDDNATNRRILDKMLTSWRMAPQSVSDGAAALAALDRAANAGAPFRLVLSDVNMPKMDGFMLFESTRSNPRHRDVPFILLTSAARPGDIARCREIGVAAHLIKPVKQSRLLAGIVNAAAGKEVVATSHSTRATTSTPKTDRTLQILLAEDNLVNQKFAVRAIEKAGHVVVVANNGIEAVDAWETGRFDVILMDVQMPELDGLEATARIRQLEQQRGTAKATPIVAMTANAMKGDKERCLEAGMDGYVSKPVKRQTLFAEIDRVLGAN